MLLVKSEPCEEMESQNRGALRAHYEILITHGNGLVEVGQDGSIGFLSLGTSRVGFLTGLRSVWINVSLCPISCRKSKRTRTRSLMLLYSCSARLEASSQEEAVLDFKSFQYFSSLSCIGAKEEH